MWCGNAFHWCRCISLRHHEPFQTTHYHPMSIRLSKAKALAHLSVLIWVRKSNELCSNCSTKTTVAQRERSYFAYTTDLTRDIHHSDTERALRYHQQMYQGAWRQWISKWAKKCSVAGLSSIWILLLKAVHKPTFFEYFDVTLDANRLTRWDEGHQLCRFRHKLVTNECKTTLRLVRIVRAC